MIDFAILTEKSENFRRSIQRFNISDALKFVREIFEPKIAAKHIDFKLKFEGFEVFNADHAVQQSDTFERRSTVQ